MHLSFASLGVNPQDTHGNPRGTVQFWYFFFSHSWEELFTFGNHKIWLCPCAGLRFVLVLVAVISLKTKVSLFLLPIYFIQCQILMWLCILPSREGLFVVSFVPLPKSFEWFLFVAKNNSLGGCPGGQPTGRQMISAYNLLLTWVNMSHWRGLNATVWYIVLRYT